MVEITTASKTKRLPKVQGSNMNIHIIRSSSLFIFLISYEIRSQTRLTWKQKRLEAQFRTVKVKRCDQTGRTIVTKSELTFIN